MKFFLALWLLLLAPASAAAVTWHVDQVNGSTGNSCTTAQNTTPSSAKLTIRAGIQCAKDNGAAGNTVEIAGGSYNERLGQGFLPSGTSGNLFTITNKAGDTVIWKPLSVGTIDEHIIDLDTEYVNLIGQPGFGFRIDGTNQVGNSINVGGNGHSVIQGIEFINTNGVNTILSQSFNNRFTGNKIHGGSHVDPTGSAFGYPFYIERGFNIIENNEIFDFPRYGIHLNDSGAGSVQSPNLSDLIVRNNIIYNGSTVGGSDAGIVCATNCSTNNKIYNNVVYNMVHGHGIRVSGSGTQVFNNTIYNVPAYGIYVYPTNSDNITIRNNIIYQIGLVNQRDESSDGSYWGTNYCNTGCSNAGGGTGTINSTADPFVNKASGDFRLSGTSGLETTGADLSGVGGFNTDYANNPRDVPWSIGAYEYVPGVVTPPANSVATLLGRTGEDIVSDSAEGADGVLDVHIRLTNVPAPITHVIINGEQSGTWETPLACCWIVAIKPTTDPSIVDLYFNYWMGNTSYLLDLTFANGAKQTVRTVGGVTPPTPQLPSNFAVTVGRRVQ